MDKDPLSLENLLDQYVTKEVAREDGGALRAQEVRTPSPGPGETRPRADLSQEERQKVEEIKKEIDVRDSKATSIYGSGVQKNIADFSRQVLSKVRAKDSGEVGEVMTDLIVNINSLDPSGLDKKGLMDRLPLLGGAKRRLDRFIAKYDTLEVQVDKVQGELENARMGLLENLELFDRLYDENVKYFKDLELYIIAGEEKVEDLKSHTVPRLLEEAKVSTNPMAMQVVTDFQDMVDRFEKRLFDMKTSRMVALQTAPQIKLIQKNDKMLVDKVTDTISTVIPLWKSQVVIALGLDKQRRILDLQREISDTSNELLKRNAAKLRQNTVDTAKELERSTIDIDTLDQVNKELIATIQDTMRIQEEAKKTRQVAEEKMLDLEDKLKEAMVASVSKKAIDG